jgi:hypothetical protein
MSASENKPESNGPESHEPAAARPEAPRSKTKVGKRRPAPAGLRQAPAKVDTMPAQPSQPVAAPIPDDDGDDFATLTIRTHDQLALAVRGRMINEAVVERLLAYADYLDLTARPLRARADEIKSLVVEAEDDLRGGDLTGEAERTLINSTTRLRKQLRSANTVAAAAERAATTAFDIAALAGKAISGAPAEPAAPTIPPAEVAGPEADEAEIHTIAAEPVEEPAKPAPTVVRIVTAPTPPKGRRMPRESKLLREEAAEEAEAEAVRPAATPPAAAPPAADPAKPRRFPRIRRVTGYIGTHPWAQNVAWSALTGVLVLGLSWMAFGSSHSRDIHSAEVLSKTTTPVKWGWATIGDPIEIAKQCNEQVVQLKGDLKAIEEAVREARATVKDGGTLAMSVSNKDDGAVEVHLMSNAPYDANATAVIGKLEAAAQASKGGFTFAQLDTGKKSLLVKRAAEPATAETVTLIPAAAAAGQ